MTEDHGYTGPERRTVTEQRLAELEADVRAQFKVGAERMDAMQADLKTNTEATARVEKNTGEMLEFFNSVKGAFRTLEMLGKLAKPLSYMLMFCASAAGLWYALRGGARHDG